MTDSFVPDRPVMCPYDDNHIIAESRLQKHIIKCSKNFPPDYRLICPFNDTHRLPKSKIEEHVAECPHRKYLQALLYEEPGAKQTIPESSAMQDTSLVECDENWDKEDDTFYEISSISEFDDSVGPVTLANDFEPGNKLSIEDFLEPQMIDRAADDFVEPLMIDGADMSMTDDSGVSGAEDSVSITSSMYLGRGRPLNYRDYSRYSQSGAGRRPGLNNNGN